MVTGLPKAWGERHEVVSLGFLPIPRRPGPAGMGGDRRRHPPPAAERCERLHSIKKP